MPDDYEHLPVAGLLPQLTKLQGNKKLSVAAVNALLESWLQPAPSLEPDSLLGLECLAWCHAMPRLARFVSRDLWCRLLEQLRAIAQWAQGISLVEAPLAHQLLNGELPLTLAYVFPEFSPCRDLVDLASRSLSHGIAELLDGEGLPDALYLGVSRSLLACWTRCSMMARAAGWECFDDDGRVQYEWTVRQALRLSRADGTLIFSNGLSGDWCSDLITAALDESGDQDDQEVAQYILPGKKKKKKATDRRLRKLPEPSVYSEWAETSVMRGKWSRKSPQVACLFGEGRLRSELTTAGRTVWSGDISPRLRIDGQPASVVSEWREICWFTDDDVSYLELEADFAAGWQMQRQIILAREDRLLLIADAVLGPAVAEIGYECSLPLANDIRFEPAGETREGFLVNNRPLATVIPLSLPEWSQAPAHGSLQYEGNQLHLRISEVTPRLYAPWLFDLAPRRWSEKRTWRQLTVAEHLQRVVRDVAVGYRIQLGRTQWLIYRSLAAKGNRTLLGQNVADEFTLGRFDMDGCLEDLIRIE